MSDDRNYGLECFRITSMAMIVLLHVVQCGGIIDRSLELGFNIKHYLVALMDIIGVCGVNCFGIISGYVGYGHKTKYSKIVSLHFRVCFYTVFGLLFAAALYPERITARAIGQAIFPFVLGTYWYCSAYFVLFFFMPYINSAVCKASKRNLIELLAVIFVVLSVLPTLFHFDFTGMKHGFGAPWLCVMYIIGAVYKKYENDFAISRKAGFMVALSSVVLTWLWYMIMNAMTLSMLGKSRFEMLFIKYTSPTMVITAISLLSFFSKLRIEHGKKTINCLGKATFGVLLFHDNPIIGETTIRDRFTYLVDKNDFCNDCLHNGICICNLYGVFRARHCKEKAV